MKLLAATILLAALSASLPVAADGLFKCKDAKGNVSYQQAACPHTSKTEGVRAYQRVAPSPGNSWTAQAGALRQQQSQRERSYEAEVPRVASSGGGNSYAADQERQARLSSIDSTIFAMDRNPGSRGKREELAQLRAQQAALATNTPYQPPERPVFAAEWSRFR